MDKRIDVLSMAIKAGLTVFHLEEARAVLRPAVRIGQGSINMAGFVGSGMIRGEHPQIDVEAILDGSRDAFLLDVRTPEEFAEGHIPGA
ncbi:MAG: rhodanese-like domain-containing protein [Isosphaeraceae bacterium]